MTLYRFKNKNTEFQIETFSNSKRVSRQGEDKSACESKIGKIEGHLVE